MIKIIKSISPVIIIILLFIFNGCTQENNSLNGNWWGQEYGGNIENYIELYVEDSLLFLCNQNGTFELKTVKKDNNSIILVNIFEDTLIYSYSRINNNHIKFIKTDYRAEFYRMPVPVRTPLNTKNYFNDTIWEIETSRGLMVRHQLFQYQMQNDLLEEFPP